MKSVWDGSLSFGLVNIPVKLFSAVESKSVSFRMLDKKHNSPIHYKRVCEKGGEEVEWKDIAKGVEIAKNKFYVLSKEEIGKIKPKSTDTIEIIQFIDARRMEPIYFSGHYYLGPATEKEKAYFLFKEVLDSTAKMAIGTFVMREKEHICAIEPYREGLLLSTLNYQYEIRDIAGIDELKESPRLSADELQLAEQLIDRLYKKEFDISKFKDSYMEDLTKLIQRKAKGEVITIKESKKKPLKEQELIAALKASLKR